MTDLPPFVPPPGSHPAPVPPSAPVAPAAPGSGPSVSGPPEPPRNRPWLVPVVILSSLGFVGIVLAVIVAVMLTMPGFLADAPPTASTPAPVEEPAPAGDGSSADAPCAGCFSVGHLEGLTLDASRYAELGLTPVEETEYRFELAADQRDNVGWWTDDRGDPDSCYFTYPKAPLLFTPTLTPEPGVADDPVYYPTAYADEQVFYVLTQGSRVFDDAGAAAAHMTELERSLVGCVQYSLPVQGYAAVVEPARALDLPAGVVGGGWVESAGPSRFYSFDLQRGNLVVRVSLNSDADGPSENEFRSFVEDVAVALAALEP